MWPCLPVSGSACVLGLPVPWVCLCPTFLLSPQAHSTKPRRMGLILKETVFEGTQLQRGAFGWCSSKEKRVFQSWRKTGRLDGSPAGQRGSNVVPPLMILGEVLTT